MLEEFVGNFHSHITVSSEKGLAEFCHGRGLKPTIITDQRGNETKVSAMATAYHVDKEPGAAIRIISWLHGKAADMRAAGFEVLRIKLEYEGYCHSGFSKDMYREIHIRSMVQAGEVEAKREELSKAMTDHGIEFFMSKNDANDKNRMVDQFVTARLYSGSELDAEKFRDRFFRTVNSIVTVVEVKEETSIYDTNPRLDDWFHPCAACHSEKKQCLGWKAQVGTLGGFPSAISLDRMLQEKKDPYLVRKVGRIVSQWYERSADVVRFVSDEQMRKEVMEMYCQNFVGAAMALHFTDEKGEKELVDKDIRTHLVCVIKAIKRKALSE